jgi:salicylate hydroxylase
MPAPAKPRILVVGAGIAGSLIVSGLAGRNDLDVTCVERAARDGHLDSGTGLNIGPNAIKALGATMPAIAETIVGNSYAWRRWSIALSDGTPLMDLDLAEVADNPGIRIRWAELYDLLRRPIAASIRFGHELLGCAMEAGGVAASIRTASAEHVALRDFDLLIAADGRYSVPRVAFYGAEPPQFLGVCLYRVLFPAGADCPIDDYGQWFNGANRLLAFRVPGDFVYLAGSFPIGVDELVSDEKKSAAALRALYQPEHNPPCREVAYLLDAIGRHADQIHWARLQDGTVQYAGPPGVLLVGDAAHPMVPTLGQGATQAVEDACVVVDVISGSLRDRRPLVEVPGEVERRRRERAGFVVGFSREATDTMLAGSDPVEGTRRKTTAAFRQRLERLYRDVAMPEQPA